jgi:uncharacterized protein (TIGR00255 family)
MIFSDRDSEVRELIARKISRGKVSVNVSIDKGKTNGIEFQVQPAIVKDCYKLLKDIKKSTGIKEEIRIEHILKFSEIFKPEESDALIDYWSDIKKIIESAVNDLLHMKKKEGRVLEKDIVNRIQIIEKRINRYEISNANIKETNRRLKTESIKS